MKKYLLSASFGLALLASSVYAANLNVGELDLDFCNGGNKFDMTMEANTQTGICMRITNLSSKAGKVMMSFVDGEMSQGETTVQACKTSADGLFGKSITLDEPTIFDIQGGESIIKTGNLSLLTGFAGNMYGCITYTVLDDTTGSNSGQMFSVVSRKANTLSIFVSGDIQSVLQLENLGVTLTNNPLLGLVKNGDKNYAFTVKIANKGTANEKLNGVVHITSNLGFHKEIPLVSNVELFPEETKDFVIPVGMLPRYGGQYTINVVLDHQPMVNGELQGKAGKITQTAQYAYGIGQYGPLPLGAGAILILLFLLLLIKKLQKHRKKKQG